MSWKSLKRWWQVKTGRVDTPIDGEGPFWILSLAFHLLLIAILAKLIMPNTSIGDIFLTADQPAEQIFQEEVDVSLELDFEDVPTDDINNEIEGAMTIAEAPAISEVIEDPLDLEMETHEVGEYSVDNDFMAATAESFAPQAITGSVGNSVAGAAGAIDRLTQEILLSIEERPTTIVWLFDQSASLMEQREEILERFDRIYSELGLISESGHSAFKHDSDAPLLTQVVAFGADFSVLTQDPTNDLDAIKDAIRGIKTDASGIENVMSAVKKSVQMRRKDRTINRETRQPKRNVKIIIVSDEAGDDLNYIEDAIQICNRVQVPVYVIGVPAPFGRPETRVKWVDPNPEYDQSPQWAIVSQGPESVAAERLRLDFTGTFGDLDMIDSGFGPYHLTRLCYETGGIYFAVHPNRDSKGRVRRWQTKSYSAHLQYFFEPEVMRRYKPDYVSDRRYTTEVEKFTNRKALVQAAAFTTTGTLDTPRLRFEKLDEGRFARQVSEAQRAAALVEPALNRLYDMLRTGESGRSQERSLRWQAGYDLAMGRTIAAKVRAETYNGMLALVKVKKKFSKPKGNDPQNNTWILRPAETTETGSQHRKLLDKGKEYLNRVIEEHPDTPWAMLAKRELDTPIGWAWHEDYTEPPRPPEMRENNNNNENFRRPQGPRELEMPKKRREPPRL
jgi:hypothetical protein